MGFFDDPIRTGATLGIIGGPIGVGVGAGVGAILKNQNRPSSRQGVTVPPMVIPEARTDLARKIFGGAQDYRDIFRSAYKNLNQPNAPENIIAGGTQQLADNFIDRVLKKTGKLPSEEQVRDFVSQNLTTSYAEKFITGEITNDSTKTQLVDPYLQANPDILAPTPQAEDTTDVEERAKGLKDRIAELYRGIETGGAERISRLFAPSERQAIEEEAASGSRLFSGVSRDPNAPIERIRARKGEALSDLGLGLATQQAAGETDVAKTIEGILQGERRAKEETA